MSTSEHAYSQKKNANSHKPPQLQSTVAFIINDSEHHPYIIEGSGAGTAYKIKIETAASPAWIAVADLSRMADFGKDSSLVNLANGYFANSVAAFCLDRDSVAIQAFLTTDRLIRLFDRQQINSRLEHIISKLEKLQKENGLWYNEYYTEYIASAIGRVENLNIHGPLQDRMQSSWVKATLYCDALWKTRYDSIATRKLDDGHEDLLDNRIVSYFYSRSFSKVPLQTEYQKGVTFWERMAASYWQKLDVMQKAMLVSTFHRMAENKLAQDIYLDLAKDAIFTDEKTVWDKGNLKHTYWYESPASRQAMLLEAFKLMREPKERMNLIALGLFGYRSYRGWPDAKANADACNAIMVFDNQLSGGHSGYSLDFYNSKTTLDTKFTGYDIYEYPIDRKKENTGNLNFSPSINISSAKGKTLWGVITFERTK